ncbi:unnamed protein product [Blepharisma stoltei]|uniref:Major facilitator superfamily (MFS) profile domain-containing protein n=1 Tax=Blepharisma stoltei TaxID=1481888 RepID=A0AAU9JEI3_9CILI|nr:unnamed protein product [Blepharisma stoltei]
MISIGYFGSEFEKQWGISNKEKGLMGTIYQLGSLLGSYLWGSISDNYGRSFSLKRSIILLIIGGFLWIFSENIIEIYILCFISGIGNIGELVLTPVVFKEFCPIKNVSFATMLNIGFPIGGLLISIIVIIIRIIDSNHLEDWKFLTIIMVFCQILIFIDRIDMDETPGFLAVNQKPQKAKEVLQNVAKNNKSDLKIGKIEIQENISKNHSRIRILLSKTYLKSSILLSIIYFLILFGTFSLLLFMPRFLKNYSLITKYTVIGLQQVSGVPTNFLASYLVNTKLGRTRTLSYSLFIISVTIFLFSLANDIILV